MTKSAAEPGFSKVEVMLIEDNPLDARATSNAIEKLGFGTRIQVLADGVAALGQLQSDPPIEPLPELILLDLNLPGKDGHDVLAEIRRDHRLQTTPVVVLSTSSDPTDIERAYRHGANAYITKPDRLDDWVHALSSVYEFWFSVATVPGRSTGR